MARRCCLLAVVAPPALAAFGIFLMPANEDASTDEEAAKQLRNKDASFGSMGYVPRGFSGPLYTKDGPLDESVERTSKGKTVHNAWKGQEEMHCNGEAGSAGCRDFYDTFKFVALKSFAKDLDFPDDPSEENVGSKRWLDEYKEKTLQAVFDHFSGTEFLNTPMRTVCHLWPGKAAYKEDKGSATATLRSYFDMMQVDPELRFQASTTLAKLPFPVVHTDYDDVENLLDKSILPSLEADATVERARAVAVVRGKPGSLERIYPNKNLPEVDGLAAVNVWRPLLRTPLLDMPLGLVDPRTVGNEDVNYETKVWRNKEYVKLATLAYNDAHAWYYYPAMERTEALLFEQGIAWRVGDDWEGNEAPVFHGAFSDMGAPTKRTGRASVEQRVVLPLVCGDDMNPGLDETSNETPQNQEAAETELEQAVKNGDQDLVNALLNSVDDH